MNTLILTGKTSNLMSELNMAASAAATVEIGMGATVCYHTDRHAATVTAYDAVKQIVTVTEDKATRIDSNGMSDSQDYAYESNPSGSKSYFKYDSVKNRWNEMIRNPISGRLNKSRGGCGLILGLRDSYHDYSF